MRVKDIKSILFVCTANSGRSPLAEYYCKKIFKENNLKIKVESAGTDFYPVGISSFSLALLREDGIDATGHKVRVIDEKIIKNSDLILCMDRTHIAKLKSLYPEASNRIFLLTEFVGENGEIEDPIGLGFEEYRKVYTKIKNCINKLKLKIQKVR